LWVIQTNSEASYSYDIDLSENSNDELVRLLLSELNEGDMTRFEMRIVPTQAIMRE